MSHRSTPRPSVVIVGAGPAGLWAARRLARYPVDVVLVDHNNYHLFLPLLWQVAGAELSPESVAVPIRSILRRQRNVRFVQVHVTDVALAERRVRGQGFDLAYDFLVLATGSEPQFYGIPGAARHARPVKTVSEAVALRSQVLRCFEQAEREERGEARRRLLTFVLVGGGPTGVELAGSLSELAGSLVGREFPGLRRSEVSILLLEAQGQVLPGFPERLAAYAARRLAAMGVELRLGVSVAEITPRAARLADGTAIEAETVAWTAGVRGDPAAASWGLAVVQGGRVSLLPSLQVAGHPEVYVAGDLAYQEEAGRPLAMVWAAAVQQGRAVARNIARQVAGQEPLPFHYRDPGSLVVVGRGAAVARLWDRPVTGPIAWLVWAWVHLMTQPSWRNRLVVAIDWLWDLAGRRTMHLILP